MNSMGDLEADEFLAFAHAATPELLRYGFLLTGNRSDAEDLLQATFERIYRRWNHVDLQGSPLAYCRRTMARLNVDTWRSVRRRERLEPSVGSVTETSPDHTDLLDTTVDVRALLSALPSRQRSVLVLRYLDDLTEQQVAAVMGTSVGTVKSQTAKAMRHLRVLLQAREELTP